MNNKKNKDKSIELLKQNEKRFRSLFENANDAIWLMDKDTFVDCNSMSVKLFKCKNKDDILNHTPIDFSPIKQPDGQNSKKKALKYITATQNGRPQRFYWRHIDKNGKPLDTEISLNRIILDKKIYIQAIGRNITEHKKTEEQLKESEEKYRKLTENSPDAIVVYIDGKIIYINKECLNLMKAKKTEDLIGKSVMQFIHPEYREMIVKRMKKVVKEGVVLPSVEEKFIRIDGSFVEVEVKSMSIKIGERIAVQLIARDITERKIYESALLKSENKYHILMNLAVDGIMLGSHQGIITDANEYMCEMLGMNRKDFIGKHISQLPFSKASLDKSPFRFDLLHSGKIVTNDRVLIRPDGVKVFIEMKTKMMPDGTYHSIYRNITEHKQTSNFLQLVLNSIPDFVFWKDRNSVFLGCNESFAKVAGFQTSKDIIGKTDYDCNWKKEESDAFVKDDRIIMETNTAKYHIIEPQLQAGGKKAWLETSKVPLQDENGQVIGILGSFTDITDRLNIENKLVESEEKYRRLFESSNDSILLLDENTGEIIDSNPFVFNLLGYSKSELVGNKIFEISPFNNIISSEYKFKEFKEKGYVRYDNLLLHSKSGNKKYVEFILIVYLVGNKKLIQCNIRDLTERNELEEAKIGFLSITSHQLRTPLSITKWVLEAMKHDDALNPKQEKRLADLIISNERLINLANDLVNVSRIETGKLIINKKNINLERNIFDLINSFKTLTDKKNKTIETKINADIKNVNCDPIIINEVLKNLLSNAINYSKEDSKKIILSVTERDNDYLISVWNEGFIDALSLEKIKNFDKFTRGVGSSEVEPAGSGLGLYITKKMIEAHGGIVWFESDAKVGTTFYVTIIKSR